MLSPARSIRSTAATIVTGRSADVEAMLRFNMRGRVCEECDKNDAVVACLECDELFCRRCEDLCHMVDPQTTHTRLSYPIHEAEWSKRVGHYGTSRGVSPARGGLVTSPLASQSVMSSPSMSAFSPQSSLLDASDDGSAYGDGWPEQEQPIRYALVMRTQAVGVRLEFVPGRGIVVAGFESSWDRSGQDVRIGDVVTSVGTKDLSGMSLQDAMGAIHAAPVPRTLGMRRDPPAFIAESKTSPDKVVKVTQTVFVVTCTARKHGLLLAHTRAGTVVKGFKPKYNAAELVAVQPGDYLVSVNSRIVDGLPLKEVQQVLEAAKPPRVLEFRRLLRHIEFAKWAIDGPAQIGVPADHSGPLIPDDGSSLFADSLGMDVSVDGFTPSHSALNSMSSPSGIARVMITCACIYTYSGIIITTCIILM